MDYIEEVLERSPLSVLIIITILIFSLRYVFLPEKKEYRLPPGPFSFPIVGSLPFLGMDIREPLRKLSAKYGDIFTVYFGSRRVIVLNSYEVLKEAFVKNANAFSGRPQDLLLIKDLLEGKGVVATEGKTWKEQRKLAHTILRNFGVGSSFMEERIQKEAHHLVEALSKNVNKPFSPFECIMPAVANVIFSVCFGNRRDYDNPEFVQYLDNLNQSCELLSNSGPITVFPFLCHLPGDPFKHNALLEMVTFMKAEYVKFIKEHIDTYKEGVTRDFIDAYLKAIYNDRENGKETELCESQLAAILRDLFAAGTETTSNTLIWGLIYMLHYPEVQTKIQNEIDTVIGKQTPCMSFKQMMPYTEACLQEIQRMADIAPLGIPHSTTEDAIIGGYEIPKNTMVIANLYNVHRDENLWPNPRKFDPNRFLDIDGKLHRSEKLIPFFMGKRVCLGASLARMELFLFFVNLLQNFTFKLPDGDKMPDLNGCFRVTNMPKRFKVILILRTKF